MMKESLLMFLSIFMFSGCFSSADIRDNYNKDLETPAYEVLKTEHNFELRQYPSYLVASVQVTGDFDEASRKGFRILRMGLDRLRELTKYEIRVLRTQNGENYQHRLRESRTELTKISKAVGMP